MTTGLDHLTARCVLRGALFQLPHGHADDPVPGAVDRPDDRAVIRRRRAPMVSRLADRTFSRGMQA
jgi:hypothetical protein